MLFFFKISLSIYPLSMKCEGFLVPNGLGGFVPNFENVESAPVDKDVVVNSGESALDSVPLK